MADTKATTKTQALDLARRANARARSMAAGAAQQADKITGFAVAVGASAGMGYYMAKSTDTDGKWMGVDKEIWVAGITAALAFWLGSKKDKASQMSANLLLSVATGVGSSYAYGVAYQKVGGQRPDFS
jgi:hypothetical protein